MRREVLKRQGNKTSSAQRSTTERQHGNRWSRGERVDASGPVTKSINTFCHSGLWVWASKGTTSTRGLHIDVVLTDGNENKRRKVHLQDCCEVINRYHGIQVNMEQKHGDK